MDIMQRARNYTDKMPPAISGEGGHNAIFKVACILWNGFALEHEEVMKLLRHYNLRCEPPWAETELAHKAREAEKATHRRPRGHLLGYGRPGGAFCRRGTRTNHGVVLGYFAPIPETPPAAKDSEVPLVHGNPGTTDQKDGNIAPPVGTISTDATLERFRQTSNQLQVDVLRGEAGADSRKNAGSSNCDHCEPEDSPTKPSTTRVDYMLVVDPRELDEIARRIDLSGSAVALDIETCGPEKDDALDPRKGDIRLLQVALSGETPWIIDLRETGCGLGRLKESLEDSVVIVHNAKFDLAFLKEKCGVSYPRQVVCTYTASTILTAGSDVKNDLGAVLRRYRIADLPKDQGRSDWSAPALTVEQLEYAAKDVVHLHELVGMLQAEIENAGLSRIFDLEMRLLPVVLKMESTGFAVDRDKIQTIRKQSGSEANERKVELLSKLGVEDLNPNSHQQLRAAFSHIGAELPNTQEETLKNWTGPGQEACQVLLKYRHTIKRVQQCDALLKSIGPDGRIHANFKPLGAETARFSCSKPNLQNIANGPLRSCFIAAPGMRLVCADYSQIELRIAAAITDEGKMLKAYRDGRDLHRLTAANVLRKAEKDVTPNDRQLAKAVNFGLLFGQGAPGLQRYAKATYGIVITEDRAAELRSAFFEAYPQLKAWHEKTHTAASEGSLRDVTTRLGRRRLLPQGYKEFWKRFSRGLNTPVQGGAADCLKKALILLDRRLPENARILSTVHDEIIIEVPLNAVESCSDILKRSMEQAMRGIYPEVSIVVDPSSGATWADAK